MYENMLNGNICSVFKFVFWKTKVTVPKQITISNNTQKNR